MPSKLLSSCSPYLYTTYITAKLNRFRRYDETPIGTIGVQGDPETYIRTRKICTPRYK